MTMKNCKRIYLTDEVIVKLNSEGIQSLYYFYKVDNLKDLKKTLGDFFDIDSKEFRSPLGDLINIFGEDVFMEGFDPFEDSCVYIPNESLN